MADPDPNHLWRYAGMGLEFATALLVMGVIGWLIDSQAGTTPWGALIGALAGAAVGLYMFLKRAREAIRDTQTPPPGPDRT